MDKNLNQNENASVEPFRRRLRRLRELRGLTIAQVASRLGISQSTYRDWEYGRQAQGEPYVRLAEIFGVTVHELLTGKRESSIEDRLALHLEAVLSHVGEIKKILETLGIQANKNNGK